VGRCSPVAERYTSNGKLETVSASSRTQAHTDASRIAWSGVTMTPDDEGLPWSASICSRVTSARCSCPRIRPSQPTGYPLPRAVSSEVRIRTVSWFGR
jgi:hypothetical protein